MQLTCPFLELNAGRLIENRVRLYVPAKGEDNSVVHVASHESHKANKKLLPGPSAHVNLETRVLD